jgi:hypothetical protein
MNRMNGNDLLNEFDKSTILTLSLVDRFQKVMREI